MEPVRRVVLTVTRAREVELADQPTLVLGRDDPDPQMQEIGDELQALMDGRVRVALVRRAA